MFQISMPLKRCAGRLWYDGYMDEPVYKSAEPVRSSVPSALDGPITVTFTMYRQSWDSPLIWQEQNFGAVYSEYIEEYEVGWADGPYGGTTLRLSEKHGTGRRFELTEAMSLERCLREVPHVADMREELMDAPYVSFIPADGRLVVMNPTTREVLLMREV